MKEIPAYKICKIEQIGTAFSFLLFPVLFTAAQIMHPDMFHIEMITDGRQWIGHFRGKSLLHIAHLLEFI